MFSALMERSEMLLTVDSNEVEADRSVLMMVGMETFSFISNFILIVTFYFRMFYTLYL